MASHVKSDVKRVETIALNQQINKEVLDKFKDYCKELGYPMNVVLESFMRQYTNNRFKLSEEEILEWKRDEAEKDSLSTTFSKEIYLEFKKACKDNGYFVRHVVTAFLDKFTSRKFILEYVSIDDIGAQNE